MIPKVKKVCIVGMGLIGGSIGMVLRKKKLAEEVLGIARRKESIEKALRIGAIDRGTAEIKEKLEDIDLVIIAVPVGVICNIIKQIVPNLRPGCVITDVGSTKKKIVAAVDESLPEGLSFIGSHPLAGSEKAGIDWARDDLFTNRTCIMTPGTRSPQESVNACKDFWKALEMQVLVMSPEEHDVILALTSHLPHIAAAGLVNMIEEFKEKDARVLSAVASGFRDTTRIAASSPDLWHDVCLSNKEELVSALKKYQELLSRIEESIKREESPALMNFLERARKLRNALNKNQRT